MATITIPMIKSAYVKQEAASSVIHTDTATWYQLLGTTLDTDEKILLMGFGDYPSGIRHKALKNVSLILNANVNVGRIGTISAQVCDDFDPDTVTYLTKPNASQVIWSGSVVYLYYSTRFGSYSIIGNVTAESSASAAGAKSMLAYFLLNKKSLRVYSAKSSYSDNTDSVAAKTVLQDGTSAPYITIEYDDSVNIVSNVGFTTKLGNTINNGAEQTVAWNYTKTSGQDYYCADQTWNQQSAVFFWKEENEESWNQIPISGNTKNLTIPANTFPTGSTIQYYLRGTDEDGTTTQTDVFTATVPATQITPSGSPTSGYVNPRNERSFGWYYGSSAGTVASGNTTLHWRVSGESAWNDVAAAQGADSLTIPANTFPTASTIEWYLSGTDSTGYASQTSVYSFSTSAGLVTATPVSPISTVESNNEEITLAWTYTSADGFAPSRFILYWKLITDDSWTVLVDSATAATSYTAPAYTFTAGEVQWRVLPYNIDGVAGSGNSASFIAYGVPEAPVVSAEAVPFTKVSWQATGQEAYEVQVDEDTYGPYFGTEKQFVLPEKLEDGQHIIRVRIIGNYGLWSQYGTAIITVENQPGEEIALTGMAGTDATLSWTTEASEADFLIYRDDAQVGHTAQMAFMDRMAAGEHRYYVINRLQNGNYSKSNEITLDIVVTGTFIAALPDGEWLEIKYSKEDKRDPEYEVSADGSFYHLAGDEWPSGSLSGYKEKTVIFSALFLREQETERKQFESLLGKAVILKFRDGTVFPTVLDNWNKEIRKKHWTAYSFTLRRIEWEDYTDDTE